jgi:hypothetical protein
MLVWRYAWALAPLLATIAIGVAMRGQGMTWLGWVFVAIGLVGLGLVILKEFVERPERAHALYRIDGPQATYCYSYVEFRRLPREVREDLLSDARVLKWYRAETRRHGGDMIEAYGTRFGKLRHRLYLWAIGFLT